jgi:hypothetical protein
MLKSVLNEGEHPPQNALFDPSGLYDLIEVYSFRGFIHTLDDENYGMTWNSHPITDLWRSHLESMLHLIVYQCLASLLLKPTAYFAHFSR